MRCVIITGLSGAGRSQTLHQFEDMGYFCVDNLPPQMLVTFIQMCTNESLQRVAVVVDTRARVFFNNIYKAIEDIRAMDVECDILYLETSDEVLIRRYKESRRKHPMNSLSLASGISEERKMLSRLRDMAKNIIDTSALKTRQLADIISSMYDEDGRNELLPVIVSFGYKNGIPLDADLVFDVRFMPNPFYVPELRELSGKDKPVTDYLNSFEYTKVFLNKLYSLLKELLPFYKAEGKYQLVIAIGCTGGRHRSVAVSEMLHEMFTQDGIHSIVQHRDFIKDVEER